MDYIINPMLTYIIFFIISLLFSFIDFAKINSIRKKGIFILFTSGIILFMGGRFYCDNDYSNYISFFNETPPLHKMDYSTFMNIYLLYQVEPLFFLFSSIFKMIGLGGQSIIFFYTICTFTFFSIFILRTSSFPFISLFLYSTCYFSLPFMQMRFGLASSCCIYAILKLNNGQSRSYWKWQIIAILFHFTALAGFTYFCIRRLRITPKYTYIILLSSLLLLFFPIRSLFSFVVSFIGMHRYLNYLNEEALSLSSTFLHIIIFSPLYIFHNKLRNTIPEYDMFLKLSLLSILLMVVSTQLPILTRFAILFATSSCCFIPAYISLVKKDNRNVIIVWILICFYALLKFYPSLQHIDSYHFFI